MIDLLKLAQRVIKKEGGGPLKQCHGEGWGEMMKNRQNTVTGLLFTFDLLTAASYCYILLLIKKISMFVVLKGKKPKQLILMKKMT